MTTFRDEKGTATADHRVAERHRLGRGSRFVEERGVRDLERGQVGDHGLEVEERFEAALRDLGLVGRVGGVPAGIFQDVALDDGRDDAIGITGADEIAHDLVLLRKLAQLGERFLFGFPGREIEGMRQANVFRDGRINQVVEIFEADSGEHGADFVVVRPDVPGDKATQFLGRLTVARGRFLPLR